MQLCTRLMQLSVARDTFSPGRPSETLQRGACETEGAPGVILPICSQLGGGGGGMMSLTEQHELHADVGAHLRQKRSMAIDDSGD